MKITILIALGLLLAGCSENSKTESTKKVVDKIVVEKEVVAVLKEKPEAKVTKRSAKTGQEIFMTCAACHGKNAQKVAMGKSKIIKGWDSAKVLAALNGYKAGTYGGTMKGLMKGQVSKLNDLDMAKVAEYISKL